jgi:tRNA(fMet)-specific endonuclease VapC
MPYLLDSDVISAVIRPRPSPTVLARLRELDAREQYTSAINVGEILYGALRRQRDDLIRNFEYATAGVTVLPFDELAARVLARIKVELEVRQAPLDDADLRIGAVAIVHDLIVATGTVRHFGRIPGLRVENWLAE